MKIFIIGAETGNLVNFRGDLIRDMVKCDHQVVACAPESGYETKIADLGVEC